MPKIFKNLSILKCEKFLMNIKLSRLIKSIIINGFIVSLSGCRDPKILIRYSNPKRKAKIISVNMYAEYERIALNSIDIMSDEIANTVNVLKNALKFLMCNILEKIVI